MIVDAHTHIHPNPQGFGATKDASADALVASMAACGIERCFVLAIEPDMDNEFIASECARHPCLTGFVSVHPLQPAAIKPTLDAYLGTGRMHGVKLHPRRQGFTIEHTPQVIALVEQAAEFNVPILIDAFPYGDTYFKTQEVRLINDVAAAVPKAKIILAHAGGAHGIDALMAVKANPNVVVDVSFTPFWFAGSSVATDLLHVLRKIGANRILHGSDSPEVPPARSLEDTRELIEKIGFNDREAAMILGTNALRLLDRNQPAIAG